MNFKRLLFSFCAISYSFLVLGQEDDAERGVQDAEIIIEKDRQIKLNSETKLYEYIKYNPENEKYEVPNDGFEAYEFNRAIEPTIFDPPQVTIEEQGPDYRQFLKAGFGNYGSPIIDLSLSTPSNTNLMMGLNYKHLSYSKGEVDEENSASSFNELTLYALAAYEKVKIKPSIWYSHNKNYFYGYTPVIPAPSRNDIKRTNNFFGLGVDFEDNTLENEWSYLAGFKYDYFIDSFENSENTFTASALFDWKTRMNLESELMLSSYNVLDSSQSRFYYRLLPYYQLAVGDLLVDLGLSVNGQNDDVEGLNTLKVFPYVNAIYNLNKEYSGFLKIDAGYDLNTMNSIARDLSFLSSSFSPQNTQVDLAFESGVKGLLTDKLSLEVKVGYKRVKNFMVFVNDQVERAQILPNYDDGKVVIGSVGLAAQYFFSDDHDISFTSNLYGYNMSDEQREAYHRPTIDVKVKGNHTFIEKLTYQWQFGLLAGIEAINTNGSNVTLDPIPKLDMMIHYQIIERIGGWVSFDNMLSQEYSRYLYYPERKFMFKLGASVRF
ncbi:TonB-dependent receptor [Reichenbachiella versicolor]|uniref:hypothetical protein n=1 Tax=Reichenbachiella versicolor TaxID=1821036 RepID=UPI0013A56FFE|nr:hypothetical protein [Reichenbachiella versicolor]